MSLFERALLRLLGPPNPYEEGGRVVDIMGRRDPTSLYLRRFGLLRTRWFRLYLHKVLRSDDDADPHDHPWPWATLVLRGGYIDEQWTGGLDQVELAVTGPRGVVAREPMLPGTFRRRRAEHLHRLQLLDETRPTWTLVLVGRTARSWGFVTPDRGWIPWRTYLAERRHPDLRAVS